MPRAASEARTACAAHATPGSGRTAQYRIACSRRLKYRACASTQRTRLPRSARAASRSASAAAAHVAPSASPMYASVTW